MAVALIAVVIAVVTTTILLRNADQSPSRAPEQQDLPARAPAPKAPDESKPIITRSFDEVEGSASPPALRPSRQPDVEERCTLTFTLRHADGSPWSKRGVIAIVRYAEATESISMAPPDASMIDLLRHQKRWNRYAYVEAWSTDTGKVALQATAATRGAVLVADRGPDGSPMIGESDEALLGARPFDSCAPGSTCDVGDVVCPEMALLVEGKVVDGSGNAVAGATVYAFPDPVERRRCRRRHYAVSGNDGGFSIRAAVAERAWLAFAHRGEDGSTFIPFAAGARDVRVALLAAGSVSGSIKAADPSILPCVAQVEIVPKKADGVLWWSSGSFTPLPTLEVAVPGGFRFPRLAEGSYTLSFYVDLARAARATEVLVKGGEETRVGDIVLDEEIERNAITVFDESHSPVSSALVSLSPLTRHEGMKGGIASLTGKDGSLRIALPRKTEVSLTVTHATHPVVTIAQTFLPATVVLAPGAEVLLEFGAPVQLGSYGRVRGFYVALVADDDRESRVGDIVAMPPNFPERQIKNLLEGDSQASFKGIAARTYAVVLTPRMADTVHVLGGFRELDVLKGIVAGRLEARAASNRFAIKLDQNLIDNAANLAR